ncbi:MAG: hypothetical protein ABIA77_01465 [Candidatus Omnitrophota bacterium]
MSAKDERLKIRDIVLWVSVAALLRLAAMVFAAHSDVIFVNYFPSKLAYQGVFDIYRYIDLNFSGERVWSYYPPMTYYVLGAFQFLMRPFDAGFDRWIHAVYFGGLGEWLAANKGSADIFRHLFFMKLPYAFFDALCVFCVVRYMDEGRSKKRALKLWSVNPVILYGVYMFGQVDIMPAALTILSILMIKLRRIWWGFFLLSVAALFKTFPVFLILPFMIVLTRSGKELVRNLTAVAVPFIVVLLPLYLSGGKGVIGSLFPRFYVAEVTGMSWEFIPKAVFAALYVFLLYRCVVSGKEGRDIFFPGLAVSVLMLVYTVFFVPVHYFVWVMPILIVTVCLGMVPEWVYWAQISCLFLYALNSALTTTALFAPLNPDLFLSLPGLPDIMHGLAVRWGAVMLAARMVFTAICVLVAMGLIGLNNKEKKHV